MKQLESHLIREFRNRMNDHHHYVMNRYRNVDGKNHWNVICSAMDWIQVAVEGIPHIDLNAANQSTASLNLLQLICALDLVVESVKQLHRVFKRPYPYDGDRSIFKSRRTDDEYFKHVRSMFGVHPVNLKEDERRYFASWSTPKVVGDFSVVVYSNQPNEKATIWSVQIADLFEYTLSRYNLLYGLLTFVETAYQTETLAAKARVIATCHTIEEQIDKLLQENELRFGRGEVYWAQLEDLKALFSVDDSTYDSDHRAIVVAYRHALKRVIDEIQTHLQNVEAIELREGYVLDPFESMPYSYEKGKLLSYLSDAEADINGGVIAELALTTMIEKGLLPDEAIMYHGTELRLFLSGWQWDRNRRNSAAGLE